MVKTTGSSFCIADQPGILEYPQVLGDGWPADGKGVGQFLDGEGPGGQAPKDGQPGGVSQGFQSGL